MSSEALEPGTIKSPSEAFLDISLGTLTLKTVPGLETFPEPDLPSEPAVKYQDLNLRGPSEQVNHLNFLIPPEILYVGDICPHQTGTLLCGSIAGLWFFRGSAVKGPELVSERSIESICVQYDGKEAFAVSGEDNLVRKWDLRKATPVATDQGFSVFGSKRLSHIAQSVSGLITVSDGVVNRVTVHDSSGNQRFQLKLDFQGGEPVDVAWLSDHTLVVGVWGSGDNQWVRCIEAYTGRVCWSVNIAGAFWLNSREGRVYVGMLHSTSFTVLQIDSGQELELLKCGGDAAVRVIDIEGILTAISYRKKKSVR